MRAIILSLLVAALVPAFTASTFAGTPAPSGKAPVSTADSAWSSTILGFGVKTNDKYTEGNVFLTVPLMSTIGRDGKLGGDYIFIEPYSSVGDGGEVAASLGLAWRHLFSNQSVAALQNKGRAGFMEEGWFLGGNLFIDMLDTQYDNQFWQLGLGAEVGNRYLQLTGNYYIPLTGRELAERNVSTRSFSNTSNSTKLTSAGDDPFATGNAILQNASYTTYANTTTTTVRTVSELYEKGMEGWDAQLAVLVPWLDQWVDLKLIGGYFSFDNQPFGPQKGGTGNVHGWKAGAEFRPVPAVLLSAMWYQDERLTGNDWTMGLQLQVPLGKDWKDSFKPRRRHLVEQLAEPVHRQNDAVKIGNEQEVTSTSSVKRTTRIVKQTPTQIVLKDDVIFVNNGPAVGNGIQAGDEQTGDGTAEKPKAIIQSGADIAGANSNSTGRVWNVYTQGGSGFFGEADYFEKVSATGSTNFIGSGIPVVGVGGKSFGKGKFPALAGGFESTGFGFLGVAGYFIGGVAEPFPAVRAENVGVVKIVSNSFTDIPVNTIELLTTGTNTMEAAVLGNTLSNIQNDGIHAEAKDSSNMTLVANNNEFFDSFDDYISAQKFDSATLNFTAIGNSTHSATGAAIRLTSEGTATGGVNFDIRDNFLENGEFSGIDMFARDGGIMRGNIIGNTIDNQELYAIYIFTQGSSVVDVQRFDGNSLQPGSASNSRGIHLTRLESSILQFNGTLNNQVGAFANGRVNVNFTDPSGTFIMNGAPVVLPADVP